MIDDQVGRLLDAVDDTDMWDEVLVIVSTDHGGSGYRLALFVINHIHIVWKHPDNILILCQIHRIHDFEF